MDKVYAQLLPPWLGGDAAQVTVDGFEMNASAAFNLVSLGAARLDQFAVGAADLQPEPAGDPLNAQLKSAALRLGGLSRKRVDLRSLII
jgi:hypothetical protein